MHSLRSKWFAVLLACVFMFAAYGHSPAAELPQTGALAPAEALQLMDTLGDTERTYGASPRRRLRPAPLPDRTPG